jgi:hypothetical protein
MPTKLSFGVVAAFALVLGVAARPAVAQLCTSDRDCPQGHACTASKTIAPTEPACPRGATCPKPDASAPMVIMACEPKACSADADCGAGMVCFAQTSRACSGGAAVAPCAPDQPCDAGPPVRMEPECTTTTTKICAWKWQLPCNMDSDCGAGFTCKPTETGSCSGSGGTGTPTPGPGGGSSGAPAPPRGDLVAPPADGGAAPPPMCTTMTSYPGWCQPTVTTCTADSDCPGGWKCAQVDDMPVGSPGSRPGLVAPPAADAGAAPARMCVSSYGGLPQRGSKDDTATPTAPGGANGGATRGENTAPPPAPPAPPPSASGGSGGSASNQLTSNKSGGCTISAGAGSSSAVLGLLAVLGLGLVWRRRR